ncbi:hypothetical protein AFL01nite_21620 [Aeromicrobium flavum]|uniref:Uncharacterized protein n=2 Tax=Aeromicrobium flavum TaxID=416568 RepID=A0A512HWM7_9ACTN|nr:hypothetical protein AFL01nite_21620 [Aeromicrobium flavum]
MAGLLAAAAAGGADVRPIADEWCLAAWTWNDGVDGIVDRLYFDVNGRAANAAANGVVYSFGLTGSRILPLVLIVGYVAGIFLLLRLGGRLTRCVVPRLAALAAAGTVTVLLLMAGRVVYQVLYWAPGSLSHTLPPLIGVWALVLVLAAELSGRRAVRVLTVVVLCLAGFVIGTLSEAFVLVSGIQAAAAGLWLLVRRAPRRLLGYPAAWCVGLVAGFAMLYLSPGRSTRQARAKDKASLLSSEGLQDLLRQWASIWEVLLTEPLHLAAIAVGVLLGLSVGLPAHRRAKPATVFEVVAIVALVALTSLGVMVALRVGYGVNGWSYERVWTNFVASALLSVVLLGAMLGAWVRGRLADAGGAVVAVAAGGVVVLCAVGVATQLTTLHRDMAARSVAWDEQDARVKRLAAQGQDDVAYAPHPIGGLTEPFTYRDYEVDWVARCVEYYYGVDRLHRPPTDGR